ncbi:hypothetical protein [Cyanobium sp. ATX 6A2]|uniref:hypothetical protein n=1 Tax=Cyanobium sp. ATX 6A2 TaxID=2823700 RepID=UPI0020CE96D0|nr:hypothetical protein [Cyanobium sp. ATX 6A2]
MVMEVVARLVHAEPGARVVEVSVRRQGQTLGSALGEAATAEEAEERALERLRQRLGLDLDLGEGLGLDAGVQPGQPRPVRPPSPRPVARPEAPEPAAPEPVASQPAAPRPAPEEPAPDPEDWSGELAQIDLQLRRIGWQRDQETTYLQRAFGHPSRARITTFANLMAYLQVLQGLASGSDPTQAPVPLRRPELLGQCDQLLAQLGWDAGRGRLFLEQHFALASRQQLSDSQLLQFNMLLEEILINPTTVVLPSTGAGG